MLIFCIFPGDDNPGKKLHKLKRVRPRDTDCGPSVARGHFNMPSSPSGYKSQQTELYKSKIRGTEQIRVLSSPSQSLSCVCPSVRVLLAGSRVPWCDPSQLGRHVSLHNLPTACQDRTRVRTVSVTSLTILTTPPLLRTRTKIRINICSDFDLTFSVTRVGLLRQRRSFKFDIFYSQAWHPNSFS